MMAKAQPLTQPPQIPEAITYFERLARGESAGKGQKGKQIEELYFGVDELLRENLLRLVRVWGDQPALRQILFYHYLHREPLMKEILEHCIYQGIQHKTYRWREAELRFHLQQLGLNEAEQVKSLKIVEKALTEMKMLTANGTEKYIEYQRPTVEAVAYALYAEYGDGFPEGKRFALKNPPLEQILEHAAFPAYFLLDPRAITLMLEACRIKNYVSLEARGGLNQYALIYHDLAGLVEFMVEGGRI